MLCDLFLTRIAYLERTHAMRLEAIPARAAKAIRHSRQRYALALARADHAETPKAKRKAERRAAAARRSQVQDMRALESFDAWDMDPA